MHRRALGVGAEHDAQAERRPWRRGRPQMRQRRGGGVAIALQRVDAQIERRAAGERGGLLGALVAEHAGEIGIEPFRIVARHMRRRTGERAFGKRPRLAFGERRRREARAVGEPADRGGVWPRSSRSMPSTTARGGVLAHQEGGRRLSPQRVVDEAGDRGAIARTGEAMREAPVLERRRPPGGGASSISAKTSMAAEMRADGVIRSQTTDGWRRSTTSPPARALRR